MKFGRRFVLQTLAYYFLVFFGLTLYDKKSMHNLVNITVLRFHSGPTMSRTIPSMALPLTIPKPLLARNIFLPGFRWFSDGQGKNLIAGMGKLAILGSYGLRGNARMTY